MTGSRWKVYLDLFALLHMVYRSLKTENRPLTLLHTVCALGGLRRLQVSRLLRQRHRDCSNLKTDPRSRHWKEHGLCFRKSEEIASVADFCNRYTSL
ncbi:hypothetical protein Bca101_019044 [Brassica carinata]